MAARVTAQAGPKSLVTTWVGGVKPVAGDTVTALHALEIDETLECLNLTADGAIITHNAGIEVVFDDNATAGLFINDDGGYDSQGTYSSPCVFRSTSTNPTNRYQMFIHDVSGSDSRTLDFKYVEARSSRWMLGHTSKYVFFQGSSDPVIYKVDPPIRDARLDEHEILGRDTSRVYPRSHLAGEAVITGTCRRLSFTDQVIREMKSGRKRVCLMTDTVFIPRGYISRERFVQRNSLYYDFSISVREDE